MMEHKYKESLWKNFAAAIDMFKETIRICPDELWNSDRKFYYLAYHTLIFLDYYLTHPVKDFSPPLTYTLSDSVKVPEGAVDDVLPDKHYSREDVLGYIDETRVKCRQLILDSPPEKLTQKWIERSEIELHGLCPSAVSDYSVLDILFYNLRHLQHHTGQMNQLLRQRSGKAADWISQAE